MVSIALHGAAVAALYGLSFLGPSPAPGPIAVQILVDRSGEAAAAPALPAPSAPVRAAPRPAKPARPRPALATRAQEPRELPAALTPPGPAPRPEAEAATTTAPGGTGAEVVAPNVASQGPGGGTGEASAPGDQATPGAGARGDVEAAVASYVALVRERIEAHKRYPGLARSRRAEGTVVALVHLEPGGGVRGVEIVESPSGLLSEPTREAILTAGPFPPPPGELRRIRVPIRYALN